MVFNIVWKVKLEIQEVKQKKRRLVIGYLRLEHIYGVDQYGGEIIQLLYDRA